MSHHIDKGMNPSPSSSLKLYENAPAHQDNVISKGYTDFQGFLRGVHFTSILRDLTKSRRFVGFLNATTECSAKEVISSIL